MSFIGERILVQQGKEVIIINAYDILYLEKIKNSKKTRIITESECIEIIRNLNSFSDLLNSNIFFRTHKTFIVNLLKIRKIIKINCRLYKIIFEDYRSEAFLSSYYYNEFENKQKTINKKMIKFFKILIKHKYTHILRIYLGLNLIISGLLKTFHVHKFLLVISSYNLFENHIISISIGIISWELFLGLLLIFNIYNKLSSALSMLTFTMMTFLLIYKFGDYLPYGCGCFNFDSKNISIFHIIYDVVMVMFAYACFIKEK